MTDPTAYDALHHLTDEVAWLHARCRRVIAQREANQEPPARSLRVVGKPADCCVEARRTDEDLLRRTLDAKLEARRAMGQPLPLDKLCGDHDLGPTERMAILLAVLPCISVEASEVLGEIGPSGFAIGSPSPEILARVLELDVRGQLELRRTFAPDSPLMVAGLVEFDLGRDGLPDDFPTAAIRLTAKGWTALTGLPAGDEEASEA